MAPRAPEEIVRPRRSSGVIVRPLNFTVRPRVVKAIALAVLIAGCHAGFVFAAYGTGVFGLARFVPGTSAFAVAVAISSLIAGLGYYKALSSFRRFPRIPAVLIASLCALVTLYVGLFLGFNTFGT